MLASLEAPRLVLLDGNVKCVVVELNGSLREIMGEDKAKAM